MAIYCSLCSMFSSRRNIWKLEMTLFYYNNGNHFTSGFRWHTEERQDYCFLSFLCAPRLLPLLISVPDPLGKLCYMPNHTFLRCAMCQIPPSTSVLVRLNHISIILIAPILSFAMQRCDFFPPSLIFNTFSVFLFIFKQITGCPMLDTPAISCSLGGTWQQTFPCSTTAEKNAYFHGPHSKQQDVHVMH